MFIMKRILVLSPKMLIENNNFVEIFFGDFLRNPKLKNLQ